MNKREILDYALLAALLGLILTVAAMDAGAQNSDPAGQWSTCVSQTGKKIVVDGPTCPRGWRKLY
jgi:hypothetical protein